ncbi:RNA polymerase sigma factor [Candidatus Gottesmanbacteria bacterium]|nr:RNA polymerase sigma factor [Candidatus Gottesmanbacteria bacterium]
MTKLDDSKRQQIEKFIKNAKTGKTEDFGKVYDLLVDHIFQFTVWRVKTTQDAQDLTEEVFKKAWIGLSKYKANNFCAYIFTIARNTVIDHYRKRRETTSIEKINLIDETDGPFDRYIKGERQKLVRQALTKLPTYYREVIILRFMQELSVKEAALALKKTQISIRVAQFRALRTLKKILKNI